MPPLRKIFYNNININTTGSSINLDKYLIDYLDEILENPNSIIIKAINQKRIDNKVEDVKQHLQDIESRINIYDLNRGIFPKINMINMNTVFNYSSVNTSNSVEEALQELEKSDTIELIEKFLLDYLDTILQNPESLIEKFKEIEGNEVKKLEDKIANLCSRLSVLEANQTVDNNNLGTIFHEGTIQANLIVDNSSSSYLGS